MAFRTLSSPLASELRSPQLDFAPKINIWWRIRRRVGNGSPGLPRRKVRFAPGGHQFIFLEVCSGIATAPLRCWASGLGFGCFPSLLHADLWFGVFSEVLLGFYFNYLLFFLPPGTDYFFLTPFLHFFFFFFKLKKKKTKQHSQAFGCSGVSVRTDAERKVAIQRPALGVGSRARCRRGADKRQNPGSSRIAFPRGPRGGRGGAQSRRPFFFCLSRLK